MRRKLISGSLFQNDSRVTAKNADVFATAISPSIIQSNGKCSKITVALSLARQSAAKRRETRRFKSRAADSPSERVSREHKRTFTSSESAETEIRCISRAALHRFRVLSSRIGLAIFSPTAVSLSYYSFFNLNVSTMNSQTC